VFGRHSSIMFPSERGPPVAMILLASSATKQSTTQNAAFVPGHKSGELVQCGWVKCAAGIVG
jgi:hypothetical protein